MIGGELCNKKYTNSKNKIEKSIDSNVLQDTLPSRNKYTHINQFFSLKC